MDEHNIPHSLHTLVCLPRGHYISQLIHVLVKASLCVCVFVSVDSALFMNFSVVGPSFRCDEFRTMHTEQNCQVLFIGCKKFYKYYLKCKKDFNLLFKCTKVK